MGSLLWRQRLDGQRMDLTPHELPERAIDELVPGKAALAGKLGRNDARRKMGVIVGLHLHLRPR
jgi:hypothetical protein